MKILMSLLIVPVSLLGAACSDPEPAVINLDEIGVVYEGTTYTAAEWEAQVAEWDAENAAYEECLDLWDTRVDEWNELTVARDAVGDPDVVDDGVTYATADEWFDAQGWPTTYEETCE